MNPEHIVLDVAGDVQLPIVDVLTGCGFITGKSGSGKSNTASVIAEELLDAPAFPRGKPEAERDGKDEPVSVLGRFRRLAKEVLEGP